MIVGRKLRIQFTQAVKESLMDLFKMGLDPVPVIVELDVLVNFLEDLVRLNFGDALFFVKNSIPSADSIPKITAPNMGSKPK